MRAFIPRLLVAVILCVGASPCAYPDTSAAPKPYTKEATWQKTMLACRAACQEAQKRFSVSTSPWFTTQSLRSTGFDEIFFPEKGIDPCALDSKGNRLWNTAVQYVDNTDVRLPGGERSMTYLYRTLTTRTAAVFPVSIWTPNSLGVWLNGAKLISEESKCNDSVQHRMDLSLKEGENTLLIKIFRSNGPYAFSFTTPSDLSGIYWPAIEKDYSREAAWMKRDNPGYAHLAWFMTPDTTESQVAMLGRVLNGSGDAAAPIQQALAALQQEKVSCDDPRWLDLYMRACVFRDDLVRITTVDFAALRRAIQDLATTYPEKYTQSTQFLARLNVCEKQLPEIKRLLAANDANGKRQLNEVICLQRDALLANPLLDFDQLFLVKRREGMLGLPQNWQGNCAISSKEYDNEISLLSYKKEAATPVTFYGPKDKSFVGNLMLHFDGGKMLFAMPGSYNRWQIWEIGVDGKGLRQVTPGTESDVDNYDACYLPNEKIVFASTRCFQGVPCVGGSNTVANLCVMNPDGQAIRQLCFDQDHNWSPTVLNNGRVMYSRWEYSDTAHYFSRILFHMNPDGTNQGEYYGSNSYWPNSMFYTRPIPGSPNKVVTIVSGHHGVPRMGELVVLDPDKGRQEDAGIVQRIPGYGKKVEPTIADTLVDASWPKFLHPYPLSEKYFLVSCKPGPDALWGIYLVDTFDNMLLLSEQPGYALLEPVAFRKTQRPPVIQERVKPEQREANVYVADIYAGQGLKGVPRGSVKNLRIFEIYYCYPKMGGHINVGVEGPWDVHRILGTVPVYEDGSAYFTVPSNMPIAVQPLDDQGRALQLMRSWFTAMPGESVSCVGCHERQNASAPVSANMAARKAPSAITPWKGPARGFSFARDVQPVLDKYCVGCHDGNRPTLNFCRQQAKGSKKFPPSYLALHPYVRRPGPESDYHILTPLEFHASTSQLIQMLEKGHHGVKLDTDAWERLYAWIDLNVPEKGTWGEDAPIPQDFHERRIAMRTQYANRPEDPEIIPDLGQGEVAFVQPEPEVPTKSAKGTCRGWPFDAQKAATMQEGLGSKYKTIDLGNGVNMDLVLVPAGKFVMGSPDGHVPNGATDECPASVVEVKQPFWMGSMEVTNAQFKQFNANHDNGFLDQHHKDHTTPGYSIQDPKFPAVRLSWEEAVAFCRWLSDKTGMTCTLPTEAQWEWACRAGSASPLSYGDLETDFSGRANLADLSLKRMAVNGVNPQPIPNPTPFEDYMPKDARFNDGAMLLTAGSRYRANIWGLYDMHGNAAEWTLSTYKAYPYVETDGRNAATPTGKKVVRGGSWEDRPKTARSAYRLAYEPWQCVYNVGFRVVMTAEQPAAK